MPRTTRSGKTKGAKKAQSRGAKADFIRAQPKDMPAAEVLERGKKAGLAITKNQVYTTRHGMRSSKQQTTKTVRRRGEKLSRSSKAARPSPGRSTTPPDAALARLKVAIMDVGFEAAQEVFDTLRKDFSKFLQTNGVMSRMGRSEASSAHAN